MINKLKISAQTDVGRRRDHNEDNLAFVYDTDLNTAEKHSPILKEINTGFVELTKDNLNKKGMLMLLADGMGGEQAGEVASELALDYIIKRVSNETLIPDFFAVINKKAWKQYLERMSNYINLANNFIYDYSINNPYSNGMGTTIITAEVTLHDDLFLHWVGDSRAYLYRQGEGLSVLTKDHSYVQELVDKGKIKEDMAFFHPEKNIITQSLGSKTPVEPGMKSLELFDIDRILLCSDGLNDMLQHHEIEEILTNVEDTDECAKLLVQKANDAGGNDNITVILCDVESSNINSTKPVKKLRAADTKKAGTYKTNDSFTRDNYNNLKVKVRNRNIILSILLLLVLSIGGYFGYEHFTEQEPPTTNTDSTKLENDSTEKKTNIIDPKDNFVVIDSAEIANPQNSSIGANNNSQDAKDFYIQLFVSSTRDSCCREYKRLQEEGFGDLNIFKEANQYKIIKGPYSETTRNNKLAKYNNAFLDRNGIKSQPFKKELNENVTIIDVTNDCASTQNDVTSSIDSDSTSEMLYKIKKFRVFIEVNMDAADSILAIVKENYADASLNADSTRIIIIIKKDISESDATKFTEKNQKIQGKEVKSEEMK